MSYLGPILSERKLSLVSEKHNGIGAIWCYHNRFKYLHGLKNYCQKTPKTQGCDQQTCDNLNILIRALADNKANNQV